MSGIVVTTHLKERSDDQDRPPSNLVKEENGNKASHERQGLQNDIVGKGHRPKTDLNVEAYIRNVRYDTHVGP